MDLMLIKNIIISLLLADTKIISASRDYQDIVSMFGKFCLLPLRDRELFGARK